MAGDKRRSRLSVIAASAFVHPSGRIGKGSNHSARSSSAKQRRQPTPGENTIRTDPVQSLRMASGGWCSRFGEPFLEAIHRHMCLVFAQVQDPGLILVEDRYT